MWPGTPTCWLITATHAWHSQRFLDTGGDVAGSDGPQAERAVDLYERKGAAALAQKTRPPSRRAHRFTRPTRSADR